MTTSTYSVTYSLTALPPLGSSPTSYGSGAYGINDTGQVAGFSTVAQTGSSLPGQATIWNGSTPTQLLALPGGDSSFSFSINAAGQIVGGTTGLPVSPYQTGSQATIWNGTTPTALSAPSGLISSQANAINDAGEIVGQAGNSDSHAIIWNGGVPTDLSALSGNAGAALAINNIGQVVGYSYPSGMSGLKHATIWNGTTPTNLGTLGGGINSEADGINDAGQVVGWSSTNAAGNNSIAFIWNAGTMTALGLLPGTVQSVADGINDAGQVVGDCITNVVGPFGSDNIATLWIGGTPIDLNTLVDSSGNGWLLQDALAINDVGQIVGWGFNGLGQQEAFLLTPDPNVTPDRAHVSVAGTVIANAAYGVLANDTDPIPNDPLTVSEVGGQASNVGIAVAGAYGTLTLNANGSYTYVATAHDKALPSDGVGLDTFTYTAKDGAGGTADTTLTVIVTAPGITYLGGTANATIVGGNRVKQVLDGGAGNDVVIAGTGTQVLIGGPGDTLTGGSGADTFVFPPNFGNETITNLTRKDSIDLAGLTYVSGQTKATYSGNTSGGTLTVTNGTSTVSLKLLGNYTKSTWVLSKDSTGGTIVVDPPSNPSLPSPSSSPGLDHVVALFNQFIAAGFPHENGMLFTNPVTQIVANEQQFLAQPHHG